MTATTDRLTEIKGEGLLKAYPVAASTVLYAGTFCMLNASGYAVAGADTASCTCVGIVHAQVDNSAGSNGDKWVLVRAGVQAKMVATSITQAMVGKTMYLKDDITFDDTSTNLVMAGLLMEYLSSSSGWILTGPAVQPLISGLTASAAELNILDGATLTVAELNLLAGLTATAQELINAADHSANVEDVTATNVILATESGKTFFLDSATEFVSTLPAPSPGLRFSFIVAAAPAGASYTIVTGASANIIKGQQHDAGGAAGDTGTADDTITFVDGQAVAGDRVDVISDGTSWFAYAFSKVAAGITFTQAS
jgi:hypothetical protein